MNFPLLPKQSTQYMIATHSNCTVQVEDLLQILMKINFNVESVKSFF